MEFRERRQRLRDEQERQRLDRIEQTRQDQQNRQTANRNTQVNNRRLPDQDDLNVMEPRPRGRIQRLRREQERHRLDRIEQTRQDEQNRQTANRNAQLNNRRERPLFEEDDLDFIYTQWVSTHPNETPLFMEEFRQSFTPANITIINNNFETPYFKVILLFYNRMMHFPPTPVQHDVLTLLPLRRRRAMTPRDEMVLLKIRELFESSQITQEFQWALYSIVDTLDEMNQ